MKIRISFLGSVCRFGRLLLALFLLCTCGLMALAGLGFHSGILAFGDVDINLITGGETSPKVTQSTSAVWGHNQTVVVVYEDSSGSALVPASYCGVSTSTNGGASFTRSPYKFNTGGACNGQPSVFYSVRAGRWFASFLAGRCGGNGVGLWTSPDGVNWANGSCAFVSSAAYLNSIWVDNNPASPFYGRQYAAFNDFNVGGGAPRVARSIDDGVTWSTSAPLFGGFRRAVK